jgi:MFS family permease
MLGYHRKTRSLIPVKDLEKFELSVAQNEKNPSLHVEEIAEAEVYTPRQRRNLVMIYLLFLAEAIMSSSLTSQISILLPESAGCLTMNTSFLRSILQCAYYLGSTSGLFWGFAADRMGRRRVALMGLAGMSSCCLTMGFANNFATLCILRFIAGTISSAVTVSALASLADFTHASSNRAKVIARLPVVAVCGQMGPLLSNFIRGFAQDHLHGIFIDYPGLGGQVACGFMVFGIASAEVLLLEETLPGLQNQQSEAEDDVDCEKAAFLEPSSNDSTDSLNISIVEALNEDAVTPAPSRIGIAQMVTAPSVLLLLLSFSALSLHSSTFDIILPHIGHDDTHHIGFGIPCSWMGAVMLIVKALAAVRILHFVPRAVNQFGLLLSYRRISLVFPVLYVVIPIAALAIHYVDPDTVITATFSMIATLAKTTMAGAAQVLVILLICSAAPDAASTGTLVGVVSIAELFKALTIGLVGIAYYISDDFSMLFVNSCLWSALAVTALVGAGVAWKMRETPRVGADIPQECLTWQGMFDVESDDEQGF